MPKVLLDRAQQVRTIRACPLVLPDGYMSATALAAAGVPKALAAQLAAAREMATSALAKIHPLGTPRGGEIGGDGDEWADADAASSTRSPSPLPVASSAWDTVAGLRLLSITYAHDPKGAPGPVAVWFQAPHAVTEILRLSPSAFVTEGTHAELCSVRITTRENKLRILAVVLASLPKKRSLELVELDVESLAVVRRSTLSALAPASGAQTTIYASIAYNDRYIVVGWSAASLSGRSVTIAILSAKDFNPVHTPITDTAAAFPDRPPVFDLSGRLLAYASTQLPFTSDVAPSAPRQGEDPNANLFYTARTIGERMYHGASAGASGLAAAIAATSPNSLHDTPQARSAPADGPPFPSTLSAVNAHGNIYSGTVHVVDLARSARTKGEGLAPAALISSFRAAPIPPGGGVGRLACIKFNPTGELLATADTAGHQFHIYALKTRAAPARRTEESLVQPEWLYVIYRGITTAQVSAMEWSPDSRLLHVLTKRGTSHTVALHPWGAPPSASECITGLGTNTYAYRPASGPGGGVRPIPLVASAKTSTSIERYLPHSEEPVESSGLGTAPGVNMLDQATKPVLPSGWPVLAILHDNPGPDARRVGLLQFSAVTGDVVQHELLLGPHKHTHSFTTNALTGHWATTPMFTDQARSLPNGNARQGAPNSSTQRATVPGVDSLRPLARSEAPHALWRGLTRPEARDSSSISESVVAVPSALLTRIQRQSPSWELGDSPDRKLGSFPSPKHRGKTTSAAAEIHTYAKVPHAHATHAYLVPQFKFGTYANPSTDKRIVPFCAAHLSPMRPVYVREDPRVQAAEEAHENGIEDILAAAAAQADWAYSATLSATATGSAKTQAHARAVPIPSFPVGVPARSRTWAQQVSQGIPLSRFTAAAGVASAGAAAGLRAVSGAVGGAMGSRLNMAALSLGRSAPSALNSQHLTDSSLDSDDLVHGPVTDLTGDLTPPSLDGGVDTFSVNSKLDVDEFVDGGLDLGWDPALLGRGSDVSFSDSDGRSGHSGSISSTRVSSLTKTQVHPGPGNQVTDPAVWRDEEDDVAWDLARCAPGAVEADEGDDESGWDGLGEHPISPGPPPVPGHGARRGPSTHTSLGFSSLSPSMGSDPELF